MNTTVCDNCRFCLKGSSVDWCICGQLAKVKGWDVVFPSVNKIKKSDTKCVFHEAGEPTETGAKGTAVKRNKN